MSQPRERVRVKVSGSVQGVFFRDSTREKANDLGLAGWVRNLPDGRVEALFEGPEAAVDDMVEWCRCGPSRASVSRIETHREGRGEDLDGFEVR